MPKPQKDLYTVEDSEGSLVDTNGNGGFSVFLSQVEAQDEADAYQYAAGEEPHKVIRYVRVS